MDEKKELASTLRNRLVEDILLTLSRDAEDILLSGYVDSVKGDIVTLLGLYGLVELFQYDQATWMPLLRSLENLRKKAFTDSNILHAATRADLRLNTLEEYICNYMASRYRQDPIGEMHWASEAYKLILVLCGFYLAAADQDYWIDIVDRSYNRFATVMDYYVWRLKSEPDEEIFLYSFMAEIWPATKTMIATVRNFSSSN